MDQKEKSNSNNNGNSDADVVVLSGSPTTSSRRRRPTTIPATTTTKATTTKTTVASNNNIKNNSSTSTTTTTTTALANQLCGLYMPLQHDDKEIDEYLSPFIKYDDGYHWPDLYTEIDEMLEPNVLIYAIAELRQMARDGLITSADQLLALPVTHAEIMAVVEQNRKLLETTKQIAGHDEFYVNILKAAEQRNMTRYTNTAGQAVPDKGPMGVHIMPETIIAFDDYFVQDGELVYMIQVNHRRKRVTITFRGSVTDADWAQNYELFMTNVPNPVQHHASQDATVKIHHGFYTYLFEPNQRGVKGPKGESLSEYQEIMQEHLLPILKRYAGYKLYVTGHSLGAALATLFAFEAAAEPDNLVPKPVSLFSVAGPYVGDESFCSAFQLLESLGQLRHCRVVNHKDLVTTVPKFSFRWNMFEKNSHVGTLFKHAGMGLRLYEGDTPVDILYRKKRTGWFLGSVDEMSRGWEQAIFSNFSWSFRAYTTWPWHSLREYNARLQAHRPTLETLYLNDLYARPDIVGKLVPQF